jgi:hypothetical protein
MPKKTSILKQAPQPTPEQHLAGCAENLAYSANILLAGAQLFGTIVDRARDCKDRETADAMIEFQRCGFDAAAIRVGEDLDEYQKALAEA